MSIALGMFAQSYTGVSIFAQGSPSKNWIGRNSFEDVGKRQSKNEVVPSIYYVLEISNNKRTGETNCSFYKTGYQTNEEYQCSVKTAG